MKVKIMDSSLIRRYGGAIVEMSDNVAFKLQLEGKVKIIESAMEKTLPDTNSVLIFSSEENKKETTYKRIPAADEPIFPQIKV